MSGSNTVHAICYYKSAQNFSRGSYLLIMSSCLVFFTHCLTLFLPKRFSTTANDDGNLVILRVRTATVDFPHPLQNLHSSIGGKSVIRIFSATKCQTCRASTDGISSSDRISGSRYEAIQSLTNLADFGISTAMHEPMTERCPTTT